MHLKNKNKTKINEILFFLSIGVLILTFFVIKFQFGEFVFFILSFLGLVLMIPNYYINAKQKVDSKNDNYWMMKFYGFIVLVVIWFIGLIIVGVRTITGDL